MKPRQHVWKWLLLGLVVLIFVGLATIPRQVGNSEQLRTRVTKALSEWTGGKVSLTEPWSVRYFPPLSIRGSFEVRDAHRLPLIQSITAKDIKISINFGQLLFGRFSIDGMRLNRPVITLKHQNAPPVSIDEIANLLDGMTVSAVRLRAGTVKSSTGEDLASKLDADYDMSEGNGLLSAFGALDLHGDRVLFVVDNGELTKSDSVVSAPFRLRLSGPITATFGGTAVFDDKLELNGALQADVDDGRRFLNWVGVPAPDNQSLQRLSISGPAHMSGSTLTIEDGSFTLDGNSAIGLLAVTMGKRPRIEGTLDFERLVLDSYQDGNQSDAETAPQGAWFDLALLKYFDTDLRVSTAKVVASPIELGRGGFTLTAKHSVVAAEIGELELCGGSATGRLALDLSQAKSKGSLVGNLVDINIDACLKPLAPTVPLQGVGSFKANVTSEGDTIEELVNDLTGDLKIRAENGTVPVDFEALLTGSAPLESGWSQKTLTPFETLVADCRLTAGHFSCQRVKMQTPRGSVSGAGEFDIERQTLDWSLSIARLMGPLDAAKLSTSPRVSIYGPLAQPVIRRSDRPTLEGSRHSPDTAPVSPR
jgi:AsmA protein